MAWKDRTTEAFSRLIAAGAEVSELASVELSLYRERAEKAAEKKKQRPPKKRGPKTKPRCLVCGGRASRKFRNLCKEHRA